MANLDNHKILLINQSELHQQLIEDAFRRYDLNCDITQTKKSTDILSQLNEQSWQCILLAIDEVPLSIPYLLEQMPSINTHTPIIVLQRTYQRKAALTLLIEGAYDVIALDELDYLAKSIFNGLKLEATSNTLEKQREALKNAHNRFIALTSQLPMAIAYIHEGAFINVNPEFQRFFKLDSAEALAEISFLDLVEKNCLNQVRSLFSDFNHHKDLKNKKLVNIELKNLAGDKQTADLLFARTNINQETGLQIIIQTVSEKIVQLAEAKIDIPLKTNKLLSAEFFIQTLNQVIRHRNKNKTHAVCFFEIDDYVKYKKRMGITRSDLLFHQISDFIAALTGPSLLISQLNTDVYSILVTANSAEGCEQSITQLQATVSEKKFVVDEQSQIVSINLGLVHLREQVKNPDQAFSLADVACTVSRNKKLHQIHIYNLEKDRSTVESVDFSWSGRIRDALKNNNFKLVFQPIVHIKHNPTPLYEVLIRMKSSHGNDIMPGQFFHAASQAGLEIDIDQWVISQILNILRNTVNRKTRFFINLSESSIKSMNFIQWLTQGCAEFSEYIVFEITEYHALNSESESLHFIQEMKKIGCQICIEHYGNHPDASDEIAALEADFYKIDGAFINHLATNRKHQSIIQAIIAQTASSNVQTIACFVQDADSLAILWREGVDYIQGNYLQIPNSQLSYKFEAQI